MESCIFLKTCCLIGHHFSETCPLYPTPSNRIELFVSLPKNDNYNSIQANPLSIECTVSPDTDDLNRIDHRQVIHRRPARIKPVDYVNKTLHTKLFMKDVTLQKERIKNSNLPQAMNSQKHVPMSVHIGLFLPVQMRDIHLRRRQHLIELIQCKRAIERSQKRIIPYSAP